MMIDYINQYAKELGFGRTYIASEHFGIYERYGYEYLKDIVILTAIAKCPKNAEQKIRMSRKTTKAYWSVGQPLCQLR